ncbi:MAG: aspartate aminotransferase family protein [Burkholderiales bacterium]|nr:MAG: aspartate aminotransferase family protein [Burkholderiales bacterium]
MDIDLDWDYDRTAERRHRFLSPSLRTFTAFERPLLLQRGEGAHVWDADGKRYLDCLAQNLCISVGYAHPGVSAAMTAQMQTIQHVTTMYHHPGAAQFAEELVATMPKSQDWVVHLVNSGAEAIDLAVLVARLYTGHFDLLTLRNSYHGMHFGTMAASGLALCHQPLAGAPGYVHVHNPDLYRGAYKDDVDGYVDDIRRVIDSSTSGAVAGLIVEPIQGYGGVIPMPEGYQRRAAEIVRAAGGLYISDEVQTGFGRTGKTFWAFEQEGIVPDAIVISKGIGNGFPIAALIVRRDVAESMAQRKFFNTYGANPMGCAAGRAVLRAIADEGLQANADRVGALFGEALARAARRHEVIGQVRGMGLMRGIEFVADHRTRVPDDASAARVQEGLRERGVIVGRSGQYKNVLRVNPPLCVSADDAAQFGDALEGALAAL